MDSGCLLQIGSEERRWEGEKTLEGGERRGRRKTLGGVGERRDGRVGETERGKTISRLTNIQALKFGKVVDTNGSTVGFVMGLEFCFYFTATFYCLLDSLLSTMYVWQKAHMLWIKVPVICLVHKTKPTQSCC